MLSAATLAFEILLVRSFAVATFHHFAYLAIGVAMLGLAAGGTLGVVRGPRDERAATDWLAGSAAATTLALLAAPLLTQQIALDPAQLPWDRSQWVRLALLDVLLALPFAAGSIAVLSGLELAERRPGSVYGASFVGSAAGAGAALFVLFLLPPHRAIAVPAVIAAAGALVVPGSRRIVRPGAAVLLAATLLLLPTRLWRPWRSPYKALPQVQAFPGARTVAERYGPTGVVTAVEAPAFRFAPGLSLAYAGHVPRQTGLFLDGEVSGAIPATRDRTGATAMLDWLPGAAPYAVRSGRVLVLGPGGRLEVDNALAHGAVYLTVVEPVRDLAALAAGARDPPMARAAWITSEARTVLARTPLSFDVIAVGPSGGLGGDAAGLHALDADFLHTVEGYGACLDALAPDGMLSITRWLSLPPRGTVRAMLTAVEALRRRGWAGPGRILGIRSWGTLTLLVKPVGFDGNEVARLERWSTERLFDLEGPGLTPVARFNQSSDSTLQTVWSAIDGGADAIDAFLATYPFDVRPVTDARPYPQHYLSARSIPVLLSSGRGDWLPFAEWGYVTALATLAVSVAVGSMLLLGPAALPRSHRRAPPPLTIAYFGAIGIGFMLAEIAAIQVVGLLLGHPVYAVSAVLGALLIGSGLGSVTSDRLPGPGGASLLAVAVAVALAAVALLPTAQYLQPASAFLRWVVAAGIVFPLGFLMGRPFPLGLRALAARDRSRVAWAWAANGVASVVAAPLASLVAIDWGTSVLLGAAAGCYGVAALLLRSGQRDPGATVSTAADSLPT